MDYTERDIEDWLWHNPRAVPGCEEWYARQLVVPSGRIDLLGLGRGGVPIVVEVKRGVVDSEALAQVCRYASDLERAARMAEARYSVLGSLFSIERWPIWRTVVGTRLPDLNVLHAARGMGVEILVVRPQIGFSVERVDYTPDFVSTTEGAIDKLAHQPLFRRLFEFIARENEEMRGASSYIDFSPHNELKRRLGED